MRAPAGRLMSLSFEMTLRPHGKFSGMISVVVGGSSCYLKTVSVSHMLPDLWLLSCAVLGLRMPLFLSFSDCPVQFLHT